MPSLKIYLISGYMLRIQVFNQLPNSTQIVLSRTCTHNAPRHLFYGNWIDFPSLVCLTRLTSNFKKRRQKQTLEEIVFYVMTHNELKYKNISPKCINLTSAFLTRTIAFTHQCAPMRARVLIKLAGMYYVRTL